MMMLICINQHLSNFGASIHEKVKQHWGWVEKKSVAYKKSVWSFPLRISKSLTENFIFCAEVELRSSKGCH